MQTRPPRSDYRFPSPFSDRASLLGPRLSCALGGCAFIAMSHWLGASWLGESWLGLPLGAWLVGAATGVSHFRAGRRDACAACESPAEMHTSDGDSVPVAFEPEPVESSVPAAAPRQTPSAPRRWDRPIASAARESSPPAAPVESVSIVGVDWPAPSLTNLPEQTSLRALLNHSGASPDRDAPAPARNTSTPDPAPAHEVHPFARVNKGLAALWPIGALRFGRRFVENPHDAIRHARSLVTAHADSRPALPGPSRLRIGLLTSAREAETIIDLASSEPTTGTRVDWVPITHTADVNDPALLRLDAVVSRGRHGEITIRIPEERHAPAAWRNWAQRLPMGYAGIFPARVDAAAISCGALDLLSERDARLAARLAEAAGLLGRLDARLAARPGESRRPILNLVQPGGPLERTMLRLSRALAADWTRDPQRGTLGARAAARAASAWLASWDEIDSKERRRLTEACAEILGDEPEALLRVAATRLAACEDQRGFDALASSFKVLVTSREPLAADPLAFVHAEIEYGSPNVLTLGRAAAGLCLLWATSNEQSLDYLRDDLLEDLRFAPRFIGQDQDHLLLREVIRHMDQLRSEMLPLSSAAA